MAIKNKNHWYDGWFYDKLIAPNQVPFFNQIVSFIEPDSTVIDVGCGTGFFSFFASFKIKSILGIDLSIRNINQANKNLSNNPNNKLSFQHTSLQKIAKNRTEKFDYAILSFVIHEIGEKDRVEMLNDLASIADKIIISEYLFPRPKNFGGKLTRLIEFFAGIEHYRNYKNFMAKGGIQSLAEKAGLKIISEIKNTNRANYIAVLAQNKL
ncbi:MAG: hypothetical protein A2033_02675 [Bacteroidetes bacterium GWA2_31_9]|nr:MAG: hypothetical protein A2033_02675 [Bacteroidetes bacterium GWA2_31_9]